MSQEGLGVDQGCSKKEKETKKVGEKGKLLFPAGH